MNGAEEDPVAAAALPRYTSLPRLTRSPAPQTLMPDDPLPGRRGIRATLWAGRGGVGRLIAWTLALAVAALAFWSYAHLPLNPDDAIHQLLAQGLNDGGRIYTDVVDMNWPGTFWLHQPGALFSATRLGGIEPYRVQDALLVALVLGCTAAWLLRRPGGRAAAVLLVAIYPLLYADPRWYWMAGTRDSVTAHLTWLALLATAARAPRHPGRVGAAAGVLLALAMLIKPTAAVVPPLLLLGVALANGVERRGAGPTLRFALGGVGGGLLTLAAALGLVLLQGAGWRDTLDAAWVYNRRLQNHDAGATSDTLRFGLNFLHDSWLPLGLFALVGLAAAVRKRSTRSALPRPMLERLLLPTLMLAGLLMFVIQRKAFVYQLAGVHQALLIALPLGIASLLPRRVPWRARRRTDCRLGWLRLALVAVALAGVLHKGRTHGLALRASVGSEAAAHGLGDILEGGDGLTRADLDDLADALRPHLDGADDAMLVWGDALALHRMLDVPPPTVQFYFRPLVTTAAVDTPMSAHWQTRFLTQVRAADPRVLVVSARALTEAAAVDAPAVREVQTMLRRAEPIWQRGAVTAYLRG